MRKSLAILCTLFLTAMISAQTTAHAQPFLEWDETFGGTGLDRGFSVRQTSDEGYIAAGHIGEDACLVKTDRWGAEEWITTYPGEPDWASDYAYCVQQASDGGYIFAGATSAPGVPPYYAKFNAWVVKTDEKGNELWRQDFRLSDYWDVASSIQETSDGNYIVAGRLNFNAPSSNADAFLMKIKDPPQPQDPPWIWIKYFGAEDYHDAFTSVQQTSDGGYIAAGRTCYQDPYVGDAWLVKTDLAGNEEWSHTFGGAEDDGVSSVLEIAPHVEPPAYILAGWTKSYGHGDSDAWLIKANYLGKQWDHTFGGSAYDAAYCVQQTSDGGYVFTGGTWSSGAGREDLWLLKTDLQGIRQWDKTVGGSDIDKGRCVQQTSDGYIVAGYTYSYGAGSGDVWLVKLFDLGPGLLVIEATGNVEFALYHVGDGERLVVSEEKKFADGTWPGGKWEARYIGYDGEYPEVRAYLCNFPPAQLAITVTSADALVVFNLSLNALEERLLLAENELVGDSTPSVSYKFELDLSAPDPINVPPTVGDITITVDNAPVEGPITVGTEIQASAEFSDPEEGETHDAEWEWGDDTKTNMQEVTSPVAALHSYEDAGVFTIKLTVTDSGGGSGSSTFEYVVVYDPEDGFVTGGGWIDSPEGAYAAVPTLTGKANFGFVSKYKKGATTPTGNTQFVFHVADLNFHSTEYDWLVIAGPKAKLKGSGTINNAGDYGFMLSAIDGQVSGGGGADKFRIKIQDKSTDQVIYDNQMGAGDDADPATVIGGGSIVIHKGDEPASAPPSLPKDTRLLAVFPNPINPDVWIPYRLSSASQVVIRIHDMAGRLVRTLDLGPKPAGFYTDKSKAAYWDGKNEAGEEVASGIYFCILQAGDFTATKKVVVSR